MANPFLGFFYVVFDFTLIDWLVAALLTIVMLTAIIFLHYKLIGKLQVDNVTTYAFLSVVIGFALTISINI